MSLRPTIFPILLCLLSTSLFSRSLEDDWTEGYLQGLRNEYKALQRPGWRTIFRLELLALQAEAQFSSLSPSHFFFRKPPEDPPLLMAYGTWTRRNQLSQTVLTQWLNQFHEEPCRINSIPVNSAWRSSVIRFQPPNDYQMYNSWMLEYVKALLIRQGLSFHALRYDRETRTNRYERLIRSGLPWKTEILRVEKSASNRAKIQKALSPSWITGSLPIPDGTGVFDAFGWIEDFNRILISDSVTMEELKHQRFNLERTWNELRRYLSEDYQDCNFE